MDHWEQLDRQRFLIVGGATRCGTTSLFAYLSAHPRVCAAQMKETRFFLSPDYPLPAKFRLADGLDHYARLFSGSAWRGRTLVEATSDYLFSLGTAEAIRSTLPDARVLFLLRDPVSRLVSWFRFARQRAEIPETLEFADYVKSMQAQSSDTGPQHLRALRQGRYVEYLEPYRRAFGDRMHVAFFEQLRDNPLALMTEVCAFAELDPACYESYRFEVHNPGTDVGAAALHRLYMWLGYRARRAAWGRPALRRSLRGVKRWLDRIYLPLNRRKERAPTIPDAVRGHLRDYYAEDRRKLQESLGRPVPWP